MKNVLHLPPRIDRHGILLPTASDPTLITPYNAVKDIYASWKFYPLCDWSRRMHTRPLLTRHIYSGMTGRSDVEEALPS
jgi:hypothetical protein